MTPRKRKPTGTGKAPRKPRTRMEAAPIDVANIDGRVDAIREAERNAIRVLADAQRQRNDAAQRLMGEFVLVAARSTTNRHGERPGDASTRTASVTGATTHPKSRFAMEPKLWRESGGTAIPQLYSEDTRPTPGTPQDWAWPLLEYGADSVLEVAITLAMGGVADVQGTSMLGFLGDAVSRAIRRRILLQGLHRSGWNLTRCSEFLQMGGPANVLRTIRDLGLEAEHTAAKKSGKVRAGGLRPGTRKNSV